jgi:hypothetical protein
MPAIAGHPAVRAELDRERDRFSLAFMQVNQEMRLQ